MTKLVQDIKTQLDKDIHPTKIAKALKCSVNYVWNTKSKLNKKPPVRKTLATLKPTEILDTTTGEILSVKVVEDAPSTESVFVITGIIELVMASKLPNYKKIGIITDLLL